MCWFSSHCSLAPLLSVKIVGYVGSTKQASPEFHLCRSPNQHVICSLSFSTHELLPILLASSLGSNSSSYFLKQNQLLLHFVEN